MTAISNIVSPIAGLAAQVVAQTSAPVGAPGGLLSIEHAVRASAKAKSTAGTDTPKVVKGPKVATDAATSKGITTLADAVTASMMSGANIYGSLALFGEAAGIAGNGDRVEATLRNVATNPDKYIPEQTALDVRAKIIRLCDKGRDPAEFSRAKAAVTAGSVLTFYIEQARVMSGKVDGGLTAMTRTTRLLLSKCAEARTSHGSKVDSTWNGAGIELEGIIAKAAEQERNARSKTEASRAAGAREAAKATEAVVASTAEFSKAMTPGKASAGRTDDVRTSSATTPAGLAVALGGPVPATVPTPAEAQASTAPVPVTVAPAGKSGLAEPAPEKAPVPAWAKAIDGASQALNGLGALVPNAALKSVNTDMQLVLNALVRMKKACAEAEAAAKADLPTAKLVKKGS